MLRTLDDVVTACGGVQKLARITGRSRSAVAMWRVRGKKIPAELFQIVEKATKARGHEIAQDLFSFERSRKRRRSASCS